jgi:hypothetical protein
LTRQVILPKYKMKIALVLTAASEHLTVKCNIDPLQSKEEVNPCYWSGVDVCKLCPNHIRMVGKGTGLSRMIRKEVKGPS